MTGVEAQAIEIAQSSGEGAERHMARLQEELGLTDEQAAELRAIFEEQHAKFQALRESAPEDREARREEFRELRGETHERVSALLTEEQKQRLEELHQSHGRFHGARGGHDPEQHLARLQEKLDLTDAQVVEIRAIFKEQRAKFQALHESAPEDREGRHEAFSELHAEIHERVSAVLTEEQRQRLEELMRSHARPHGAWGPGHQEN
jgi:Spy/CpxP family protein refolding chaperone